MKRVTILLVTILFLGTLQAQTLVVNSSSSDKKALISKNGTDGITISEYNDNELITGKYNFQSSVDPSLEVYTLQNGAFIVRENIANFLMYDSFGRVQRSISNSSQSEGGESVSEIAMDPNGKTIVLYNPKVVSGGLTGSRAQLVDDKNKAINLFYSTDRAMTLVEVSANGEFIGLASSKSGGDDEVQLMDRFGNILQTISFDQEVKGVTFSENGLYVAIYSGSRAAAYEIRSGERVGSTSFRNTTVQFATYDPTDKTIIGVTGSGNSTLTDIELHAVNVSARKIARKEFTESLDVNGKISLTRTGKGRYTISGLSKDLSLRAGF